MSKATVALLVLFVILTWAGSAGVAYGVVQLTGQGPKGEQGPSGAQGERGPTGPPGPPGEFSASEVEAFIADAYDTGFDEGTCQAAEEAYLEVDSYVYRKARFDPVARDLFNLVEYVYINYC